MKKIFSSFVMFAMILSLVAGSLPQVAKAQDANQATTTINTQDITPQVVVVVVDVCPNIDGNQATVPVGKHKADNGECVDDVITPPTATINATKIICPTEDLLPDWGFGGPDVTAATATNFLDTHKTCHTVDWTFEWAPNNTANPGDQIGVAGGVWKPFAGSTVVPASAKIWVREQADPNYIPFSGATTNLNSEAAKNSAELYCSTDVLNYDNYDNITPVTAGQTYNCIAFNVLKAPACDANASAAIVSDTTNTDEDGNAKALTFIHPGWTANIPGATWIWSSDPVQGPTNVADLTKTFTKTFNIVGTPTSGTLDIAADNWYSIKVNGNFVGSELVNPNNFQLATQDSFNVLPFLVSGTNTIEIKVTNKEIGEDPNPANNPAGLLYKLSLTNNGCVNPPPVDVCPNETGNQATIPQGEHKNSDGNCVPDEVPPVCNADTNLLTNGSFENPKVTKAAHWDIFPSGTVGLGWIVSWKNPSGAPAVANVELQRVGIASGWSASAGDQWTELDSDFDGPNGSLSGEAASVAISQTIPTISGDQYTVSFDFSPRPNTAANENSVDVLANNVVIGSVGPTAGAAGTTAWTPHSFNFIANSASTNITFREGANNPNNSIGTFLDNAKVRCTDANPEPPADVNVTVIKYLDNDGIHAATSGNTNSSTFHLTSTWTAANLNGGVQASGNFDLGPVNYSAQTSAMTSGAAYSVVENNVGSTCNADNQGQYILKGYKLGNTLSEALASATVPVASFTNITTNKFVIVVNKLCGEVKGDQTVKVHIYKYLPGDSVVPVQVPDNSSAPAFPMTSTTTASNINGGTASTGSYDLGSHFGGATLKYQADTGAMASGAAYTTSEVADGSVVVANSQACTPGKYYLIGYKSSTVSLADAQTQSVTSTPPSFTNLQNDAYVIVINQPCPAAPTTGHLIVKKVVVGEASPSNFSFSIDGGTPTPFSNLPAGIDEVLSQGTHTVVETPLQVGWDESVSCVYENEQAGSAIQNGESVDVEAGNDVTCTFTNTFIGGNNTSTSHTTVVKQADLAPSLNTSQWYFYNDTTDNLDNTLGGFVFGPAGQPLGAGSAVENPLATSNSRTVLANSIYGGTNLSKITSLKFSEFTPTGAWSASEAPFFRFNVDFSGSASYQKSLVFVPSANGTVTQNTWQTWDMINGGTANWIYSGAFWPAGGSETGSKPGTTSKTWSSILSDYPIIRMHATFPFMGVRAGEPGPTGFTDNVDAFVVGIKTGLNTHTETYDFEPTSESNVGITSSGGGTSGGSSLLPSSGFRAPGQVLGAQDACGIYVDKYLRKGKKTNDIATVKLVQKFLNSYTGTKLPVSGVYDAATEAAVKAFQLAHKNKILDPWHIKIPTGIFYLTTQTEVNNIMCPQLNLPIPTNLIPYNANPATPKI